MAMRFDDETIEQLEKIQYNIDRYKGKHPVDKLGGALLWTILSIAFAGLGVTRGEWGFTIPVLLCSIFIGLYLHEWRKLKAHIEEGKPLF